MTYDSEFCGLDDDAIKHVKCKHGVVASRFVAFDRCNIGRRFYGCAGQVCEVNFLSISI
jgi:hypothetical protein